MPLVLELESELFQPAWIERAAELPAGLQIGAQPTGDEETTPAAPGTDG